MSSGITIADDLLHGAAAIAQFIFGDAKQRRKVYCLIESGRLPVFRLGGISARKSTLLAWIAIQEQRALRDSS